uniref:Large ribosomal subunit protein uL2m n=1 Tax=Leiosporoceros dussii TaxID=263836 RepID=A0A385KE91_9EMBR|nr:ribosomal protein L2 [Leiosporoceros dussii]AXZ70971.1 ribosomal protein L2 [Leiosporoceros dussii]
MDASSRKKRGKYTMRNSCWKRKALKQLTLSLKRGSAGRNASGRITVFHRGGGSKRLQRKIDLKRSTSSMGIVERIEYDPNRSSWIALVRWAEGVLCPGKREALYKAKGRKEKNALYAAAVIKERFLSALLSLPRNTVDPLFSIDALVGSEKNKRFPVCTFSASQMNGGLGACNTIEENVFAKRNVERDALSIFAPFFSFSSLPRRAQRIKYAFFSTLSSKKAKGKAVTFGLFSSFLVLPRVAVAGTKPALFASRMKGLKKQDTFSQSEGRRWRTHSVLWAQRIKRKAFSWLNESFWPPKKIFLKKTKENEAFQVDRAPFTYILASDQLETGKTIRNYDGSKPSLTSSFNYHQPYENWIAHTDLRLQDHFVRSAATEPSVSVRKANEEPIWSLSMGMEEPTQGGRAASYWPHPKGDYASSENKDILDSDYEMVGNCIPLANIPIGTWIHNIEWNPGQGAKFTRAAGTFAQIIKKLGNPPQCIVRLPSGVNKLIDSGCRATIGIVSNPHHSKRKLNKAGQSRWLGRRPIVRGVAMNPVDHPHGGGEGRTKGGRPSVSPWGKPAKGGFRTVVRKHRI